MTTCFWYASSMVGSWSSWKMWLTNCNVRADKGGEGRESGREGGRERKVRSRGEREEEERRKEKREGEIRGLYVVDY